MAHTCDAAMFLTPEQYTGYYFATLIALVAVARVYRGLHYLHDVLASFLIARLLVTAVSAQTVNKFLLLRDVRENKVAQVALLFQHIAGSKSIAAVLVSCFSAQELSPVVSDNEL